MTTPTPQEIEVKAREWWIGVDDFGQERWLSVFENFAPLGDATCVQKIHVIEYSAYLKERERAEALQKRNERLVKALEDARQAQGSCISDLKSMKHGPRMSDEQLWDFTNQEIELLFELQKRTSEALEAEKVGG